MYFYTPDVLTECEAQQQWHVLSISFPYMQTDTGSVWVVQHFYVFDDQPLQTFCRNRGEWYRVQLDFSFYSLSLSAPLEWRCGDAAVMMSIYAWMGFRQDAGFSLLTFQFCLSCSNSSNCAENCTLLTHNANSTYRRLQQSCFFSFSIQYWIY